MIIDNDIHERFKTDKKMEAGKNKIVGEMLKEGGKISIAQLEKLFNCLDKENIPTAYTNYKVNI